VITPPPPVVIPSPVGTTAHSWDGIEIIGQADWLQSTLTIPATISWSPGGGPASAWTAMGLGNRNYTQVGFIWGGGNTAPTLFTEDGVGAPSTTDRYFGDLVPGSKITVATSCDLGTHTFHDWYEAGRRWKLLSSTQLCLACGSAGGEISSEMWGQAALPLVESDSFVVVDGAEVELP
jgi:hypothetical protein